MKARRPKKRATRKSSTALVRRPRVQVLPPATNGEYKIAADGSLELGALGLVELKLTAEEEAILSEPVNAADVTWKPRVRGGPPEIPYLPHPVYTRWLNRAFGRMGWTLVPIGKPVKTEESVVLIPYVLHVHKLPVAFAWGEQEYFVENKQQTYGDVVESTVASALRRCMKHLGVGLELWDRRWTDALPRPGANGREQQQHGGSRREPESRTYGHHSKADEPITKPQRQRLVIIARNASRSETEVRMWLKLRYGIDSSKFLKRSDYDDVCRYIEAPGPLPLEAREPGAEG